jgi:cell division septum initiation protein DivIVA
VSDDIEAAKEVARELHGLLKDCRQLERQIQEGRRQLAGDVASVTAGMAAGYISALEQQLRQYTKELADTVDTVNRKMVERAAGVAGMKTSSQFITAIIHGLTPVVVKAVQDHLDHVAGEALAEMHSGGKRPKRGEMLPPVVFQPGLPPLESLRNHRPRTGRQSK